MPRLPLAAALLALAAGTASAQEKLALPADAKPPAPARTVEELAKAARPAVVVIRVTGRDGKKNALGTGFVVSADGLVATNLHVLGEARPIEVQTADGKRHPVTAVHASDRSLDLALLRITTRGLPALELGDSDTLRDGQAVVALGHPRGLQHSVVSGVVSGRPKVEGRPMIQLAMPIEQGNSGGPVLDLQGRVRGIVTLKAQVTPNLGFAMPVNDLKRLLKRPNPVPIARWITIGTLNPEDWKVVFDGRWRQRNGLLIADGAGKGFGGRSLCLSQRPVSPVPFEVSVAVKLDDEAGAAGLVFHADGADQHYGFYPSNGQMRLSRFAGPDVFSWKVLHQKPSPHYKSGEWNVLKVRVEKGRILGYVNDQLVVESRDDAFTEGKVGLAKFRTTHAEFKSFRVGAQLPPSAPAAAVVARVIKAVAKLPAEGAPDGALVERMLPDAPASLAVLRDRARQLERQAARLRELAAAVHHRAVLDELASATGGKDDAIDLAHAALLIARLDNEELDVAAYRSQVDRMAREIAATLPKGASEAEKLAALNKELFEGRGFHGSRGDYYHRANSYLSAVLEDREGLPITLSLLYMELARRLGIKVEGVGLPGHFVVRHVPAKGKPQLIDVYEGGKAMSRDDARRKVEEATGKAMQPADLARVSKRDLLVRMLYNLRGVAQKEGDAAGLLRYQDAVVTLAPGNPAERLARAGLRYQSGDKKGSIADLDWLLERDPPGLDRERVMELRRMLTRPER
jgi:regulator of sirC expression with transglutaminase-like and TPR domain/S1-C subfamily serine protease